MKYRTAIAAILLTLIATGCDKLWEEHYGTVPETVEINLWEAIQQDEDLSVFVQYIKDFNYDTLFNTDNTYTLFIPDNTALGAYSDTATVDQALLDYTISLHYIQSRSINGKRKIQTLAEKFALFENNSGDLSFDGVNINYESPLYLNGKYYKMKDVAVPKPNLYEYFAMYNPVLKKYIDSQDSIVLDKELSVPLGFDDNGNTIYDSVTIRYNLFEMEYFPVSEELRNYTATIVFPREEDYNAALDEMANVMTIYNDHNDIPQEWQDDVLIPYMLERGVFENMLEPDAFVKPARIDTLKLKNILGDSVAIDYIPQEKFLCSNGYAYNMYDFHIPDTLLNGSYRFEGEELIYETAANKYAWNEEVEVISDTYFPPLRQYIKTASNDSILNVSFQKGYSGAFSVEFKIPQLFPRKYLMVVRTSINVGGIYEVYLNDELAATIDYGTDFDSWGVFTSVTGKKYKPTSNGYNNWDCWLLNTADYGNAVLKLVYTGPSTVLYNGLLMDYIDFIPYDN